MVAPEWRSHLPPDGATFLLTNFLLIGNLEAEAVELEHLLALGIGIEVEAGAR